jgi:hypothetical protein
LVAASNVRFDEQSYGFRDSKPDSSFLLDDCPTNLDFLNQVTSVPAMDHYSDITVPTMDQIPTPTVPEAPVENPTTSTNHLPEGREADTITLEPISQTIVNRVDKSDSPRETHPPILVWVLDVLLERRIPLSSYTPLCLLEHSAHWNRLATGKPLSILVLCSGKKQ